MIRHLEWRPNGKDDNPDGDKNQIIQSEADLSIEHIIANHNVFFDETKNSKNEYVGLSIALRKAQEYATESGIVLTMPLLMQARLSLDKNHELWKKWYAVKTDEYAGIDNKGLFVEAGKPVVIVVHGTSLLTPDRIEQAYADGLTAQKAAKLTQDEFDSLLEGKINEQEIPILQYDKFMKQDESKMPVNYGVVLDLEYCKGLESGRIDKQSFITNKLVHARSGGKGRAEQYFDKAGYHKLGNYHRFGEIDASQAQGRVLFLYYDYNGLNGDYYLFSDGRFVGVASEAQKE